MADGFLLDSNICIYVLRGQPETLHRRLAIQDRGTLFMSSISFAEVAVGVEDDPLVSVELAALLTIADVLPFTERAARLYGTLPFRRRGFDRLIAAHALAEGLTLVTNNVRDFADIPGLRLEDWTLPMEEGA